MFLGLLLDGLGFRCSAFRRVDEAVLGSFNLLLTQVFVKSRVFWGCRVKSFVSSIGLLSFFTFACIRLLLVYYVCTLYALFKHF